MKDNKVTSKNAFVKKEQQSMKSMMGNKPTVPAEMKKLNAFQSNSGERAEEMARRLTKGLDKKAFPVS